MIKEAINSDSLKSKGQVALEYFLFAFCLCVIALRTMFTESPSAQSAAFQANVNDSVNSLLITSVLFLSFVVWFIINLYRRKFQYRFSGIEIGLCIFFIAAIVACFAAANKRAAITNLVTIIGPVLMAVLLVQILDSYAKIRLLMAVIAALGVVSAYQCAEQYSVSNQMMIEQYEQNQDAVLEPLGIKPGTFAQFLFEHRLYTKGVRGFFTTSNSAASFALLASFAAVGLFIGKLKGLKNDAFGALRLIITGIGATLVILGFLITRSRGANVGLVFAVAAFIALICFGNRIRAHKKGILVICLILVAAGVSVVVWYGLTHGRLPGGNSMLVRWQYWSGTVKMYADYPLTGVGPGNFGSFYTHYKPAEALETVADPHNFILSIITQYGPLGLIGFLAAVLVPLLRALSSGAGSSSAETHQRGPSFFRLAIPMAIIVSAALLFIRPVLYPLPPVGSPQEKNAAIIVLYVLPVVVFIIGFLLLTAGGASNKTGHLNIIVVLLFCACLGVLIHNLIDFAIFEPGVLTTFWAILACLIALDFSQKSRRQVVFKPALITRILVMAGGLAVIWAYFNYAFIPVVKAGANINLAIQGVSYDSEFLDEAAKDDPLDPLALNLNGRLYLKEYENALRKQPILLEKAERCFLNAIERNEASFKNYDKLSTVYSLLGDNQKAYDWGLEAAKRYPGSGRLQFNLAEIAEKLGKTTLAVEHYLETIRIEDKYRSQFREMYPGREIVSRLGEDKYKRAKQRIEYLTQRAAL